MEPQQTTGTEIQVERLIKIIGVQTIEIDFHKEQIENLVKENAELKNQQSLTGLAT